MIYVLHAFRKVSKTAYTKTRHIGAGWHWNGLGAVEMDCGRLGWIGGNGSGPSTCIQALLFVTICVRTVINH